jgi:ABC-type sugar transport system permease subunit
MDAHARREWRGRLREGGFGLLVVLIVLFCVLPFVWTLITSLKTLSEIYATPATYVPRALTLDHWEKVLTLTRFTKSLLNSTIVATSATAISLLVVLLFRFIDVARMFDLPFVLTGGGPGFQTETLTMYTYRVLFTNLQFGMGSALAVSVFLVVLLFSFVFIKVLGAPVGGGGSR